MCEEKDTGRARVIKTIHPILKSKTGGIDIDLKIFFDRIMTVKVDKCIVPLIEEINEAGFPTLFSCCSHHREKFYDKYGDEYCQDPYHNILWVSLENKVKPRPEMITSDVSKKAMETKRLNDNVLGAE